MIIGQLYLKINTFLGVDKEQKIYIYTIIIFCRSPTSSSKLLTRLSIWG